MHDGFDGYAHTQIDQHALQLYSSTPFGVVSDMWRPCWSTETCFEREMDCVQRRKSATKGRKWEWTTQHNDVQQPNYKSYYSEWFSTSQYDLVDYKGNTLSVSIDELVDVPSDTATSGSTVNIQLKKLMNGESSIPGRDALTPLPSVFKSITSGASSWSHMRPSNKRDFRRRNTSLCPTHYLLSRHNYASIKKYWQRNKINIFDGQCVVASRRIHRRPFAEH